MSYGDSPSSQDRPSVAHDVEYEMADSLCDLLSHYGLTILLSTYQAGKLVALNGANGKLAIEFHNYDRPMGIAVEQSLDRLAVATRDSILVARNEREVARRLPNPRGSCFLTRVAHFTGDIQTHQLEWVGDELWFVNTRFSCLCTLDERNSFVPRWQPAFIDSLAPEDRCHLNGLAVLAGQPKYVTTLSQTNVAEGWRPIKHKSGCVIDIATNTVIADGFAMPHSPVATGQGLLLLDSGHGALIHIDARGTVNTVGKFPGYTRGLAVYQDLAIVGLSKIREAATFGSLPISERKRDLKCGFAIVDLRSGSLLSQFEFKSHIEEIFDVAVVAHPGGTAIRGPSAEDEGHETIWVVPSRNAT